MEPLGKTTELAEHRGVAPSSLVSELDDERLLVIAEDIEESRRAAWCRSSTTSAC